MRHGRAPLEELVEQIAQGVVLGRDERVARGAAARHALGQPEREQLADAVLDVQPHAAELLHHGLDVEGFVRPSAQETHQ